ncbi:hypothetical protein [Chamaesiphon sp.]|uniref:hypothetical protein n=1 Tax=Chamaesiphon sp. TaxID=2814140 RepID=UPI003592EAF3
MDSSKVITVDVADIDLGALRRESLDRVERLQATFDDGSIDRIEQIQERLNQSFRQFLLAKEQERMPFLQRVMTAHLANMEEQRGFPPRHPIHWFKSKLEFSSTGVLQFDFQKDAELFMESALTHIETEIKEQLVNQQQHTLTTLKLTIQALQQTIATRIQPVAKVRRVMSNEYVSSFIQANLPQFKAADRFYFVSNGVRFNPKQELISSEVCVRPTGLFDRTQDGNKPTQLKYAISCDRLLDLVNESSERASRQIHQQTQVYLTDELVPQIERLFEDLIV